MGVSHLAKHAAMAQQAKANSGYPDSHVSMPGFTEGKPGGQAAPAKGLYGSAVPYSAEAVKALHGPARPVWGGGRLGTKSGQPKLGKKLGGVLGTTFPNPNGGRAK